MRYSETLKSRPSRGQIEASDSSNSYLHLRSTMKLTSSLTTIVSLLALSVSAAKRPDNAPDGIYIEVVHANGTTVMEYYGPANTTAPAYALDKRDKDQGYPVCQRPAMAQERHCSRCERAQQFPSAAAMPSTENLSRTTMAARSRTDATTATDNRWMRVGSTI